MSTSINGLSGLDSYINSYADASGVGAASGTNLSGKIKNVGKDASSDELMEVCREFESYFMEQVYKEMFKTIGSEDENSPMSSLVDYFKDGAIQTAASQTTSQTGGALAQQLYEQMKRNYGIVEEA